MNPSLSCPTCLTENPSSATHCVTCGEALTREARLARVAPTSPEPKEPSEHLEVGTRLRGGAYTVLGVMGRGGFGVTYKAMGTRGTVAIKESFPFDLATRLPSGRVVSRERTEFERLLVRFQHEAETLQLLKHPSATQFLEFFEENGTAYLVMEFLRGDTLEARIERRETLRFMEARRVLFAVLEGLRELHGLGLLHRDIKPANLIFTKTGVELIDYGSAVKYRLHERIKRERLLTPMYAPLEQFGETVALSPATDFYALGATLYHALTLHAPPSALERAAGTAFDPAAALPAGDATVTEIVTRCLEMRMEDRPQTASELLELLSRGGSALGIQVSPEVDRQSPLILFDDDRARRLQVIAIFVVAILAFLVTLVQTSR
jgi:serine/threonine protein kinase